MNPKLLLFPFLLIFKIACAQYDTTAWILGGSVSFQYDQTKGGSTNPRIDPPSSTFGFAQLAPYIGKKINGRWILGTQANYSTRWRRLKTGEDNSNYRTPRNELGLNLFTRYRINPNQNLGFNFLAVLGYAHSWKKHFEAGTLQSEDNMDHIKLNFALQLSYPLSSRLFVLANLGTLRSEYAFGTNDRTEFDIRASLLSRALVAFEFRW